MRGAVAVVLLPACVAVATTRAAADDRRAELQEVARRYDTQAAVALLSRLRAEPTSQPELLVDAGLLAAELLRIEYEEAPQRQRRRLLGQQIDAFAKEALARLEKLPETSEHQRRRADLIATLIRSDFRARRHEGALKGAVARALELDAGNPRAWVAAAKPYLFAKPRHGGDVGEAVRLLTHALELDPALESARLLRAHAHEKRGAMAQAREDWRAALEHNRNCRPARRALEGP